MSILSNVKVSQPNKPARVLIYGEIGVGKTEFGSHAPGAIFISPEGGVDEIPGAKSIPGLKTWNDIRAAIKALINEKHEYNSLILDSADWLEKLCHVAIIGSGKSIIQASGGYGAGYRESETMHNALIADLTTLRDVRGMNIIITAHQQVKAVKDPEAMHDYDSFDIKCHDLVSSLWREWVDCVFFARFKTYTKVTDEEKTIAVGEGERVMYTQARPAFRAKNRYNLPYELPLSWEAFEKARGGRIAAEPTETLEEVLAEIGNIMKLNPNTFTQELVDKTNEFVIKANGDVKKLIANRNRMKTMIGAK